MFYKLMARVGVTWSTTARGSSVVSKTNGCWPRLTSTDVPAPPSPTAGNTERPRKGSAKSMDGSEQSMDGSKQSMKVKERQ